VTPSHDTAADNSTPGKFFTPRPSASKLKKLGNGVKTWTVMPGY